MKKYFQCSKDTLTHDSNCYFGQCLYDSRSVFNPPAPLQQQQQSNLIILINLNNVWYTVKPEFRDRIGGIFLSKSLSVEKLNHNDVCRRHRNTYQIYSYSHSITKKTFLQHAPLFNELINDDNHLNKVFIVHYYKGTILGHTVDFRQRQHKINKRCTVTALCNYANNTNIACGETTKPKNTKDRCFCIEHTNEELRTTKVQPLGITNCKNNLEIVLRSLGLYQKFFHELNFCSIISLFAFDIETTYERTIYEHYNTGIYNDHHHVECGNIKGMLLLMLLLLTN